MASSSSSGKPKNIDWTTPKTAPQVFEEIDKVSRNISTTADWKKYEQNQLNRAKKAYPHLDLTWRTKNRHHIDKIGKEIKAKNQKPTLTVNNFFDTAYKWDPFSADKSNTLMEVLTEGHAEDFPLGKFDGIHQFYLLRGTGALPPTGIPDDATDFDYADGYCGAIAYADGHPSEADQTITFRPKEDDRLRHVMPLGWIARLVDEKRRIFERTGHTLVMDMDEGRDRHPWIVLANSWPDDEVEHENDLVYAECEVQLGDPNVHGILPGTTQRTPIGKIVFTQKDKGRRDSVLLCFGADFEFQIQRYGGFRAGASKNKGPPLAKVMEWFEDTERNQNVCYDSTGTEYMRYDKAKKAYLYPNRFERLPNSPQSRFIPLEERFGGLSVEDLSSTPGPSRSRAEAGTSTNY